MTNEQDVRHILVVEDQKSKRIVALKENTYALGRDPNSSIIIYDRQVSRHHATLLRVTDYQNKVDFYRVIDGNLQGKRSTNGIMVNGKYTLSHELRHGDIIRFGSKAKASYHLISNPDEMELFEKSERIENLSELLTFNVSESETEFHGLGLESKNTIVFPGVTEDPKRTRPSLLEIPNPALIAPSSLADYSPNPIIELDISGDITYLNSAASLKFPTIRQLQAEHPILQGVIAQATAHEGTSFAREVELDGKYFEQYVYYLASNHLIRVYLVEITRYKKIDEKLSRQQDYYQFLVEQSTEGIFLVDRLSKKIIETNRAYCQLLGYIPEEILHKEIYYLIALDRDVIDHQLEQLEPDKAFYIEESLHRCYDGTLINVEEKITRSIFNDREIYCFNVRDISERKRAEEKLQYQALHDRLTDLPNRFLLEKQLGTAIENAARNQTLLAIAFIDIDSFKHINGTLGHQNGDRVLKAFTERLEDCVRGGDTIARWGSDEFTILLPRIRNTEDTLRLTERIFETLKQPFTIDDHHLQVKISVGIAIYPQDGDNKETLLKNADCALARAKKSGKNNYQFYTPLISEEAASLLKLETLIHRAFDKQEFSLYYQPQVKIVGEGTTAIEVTGLEALIRWNHPQIGSIPPAKFLPLAEKTDLMLQLGKWVLNNACQQAVSWQKEGFKPMPFCVNISNAEFARPNLVETVARILEKTGLDPQWLELEITEKVLRNNLQIARQVFQDFQNLGVRLSLDDFGTGQSALGYIRQFPFRTIKLDQTFIRDIRGNSQEKAIVKAAISLGKGFGFRVIAEGVETEKQLKLLRELDCEEAQGYLFAQPLSPDATRQFLSQH